MYRVIKKFRDLQDSGYIYSVGEVFPRKNMEVTEKRILQLVSNKNKLGVPLIEEIAEKPKRMKKPKNEENETLIKEE